MSAFNNDPDLEGLEQHLRALARRAGSSPHHKAHLRDALLRRHQELTAETTQRAASRFLPPFTGLKRLTLVAPPALALVAVVFAVMSVLQLSGHRGTQGAEAARLSRALARTVPTLVAWRASVEQSRGSAVRSYPCSLELQNRHLYIRGKDLYIYTDRWFIVTPASVRASSCPEAWMWAFSALQDGGHAPVYPGGHVNGHAAERIVYPVTRSKDKSVGVTAWVDRATGLVLRLSSTEWSGSRIVEQDRVDYTYGMHSKP